MNTKDSILTTVDLEEWYNKVSFMKPLSEGVFNPLAKQKIITFIENLLTIKQPEFTQVNPWGKDVSDKLLAFISQGKMIRGSLVLFMYEAYTGTATENAIRVAAAMELFHSSLLIHDDIMDNDTRRRGHQTIFAQYQSLEKEKKLSEPRHFGESMGICMGDIGFFLAFQLLATVEENTPKQIITETCMRELIAVGLAQMQDVYAGYAKDTVSEADIEKVYLYKTGRYTFSLPLILGALLAKQSKQTLEQLERLGEYIGLLFQLKDDELSLFGDEKITGKPEGSDIRENKKTLHRFYLFQKALPNQKQNLEKIFGKGQITNEELLYVRKLIIELNIQNLVDKKMQNLHNKGKETIMTLSLPKQSKDQLQELLTYISERKK